MKLSKERKKERKYASRRSTIVLLLIMLFARLSTSECIAAEGTAEVSQSTKDAAKALEDEANQLCLKHDYSKALEKYRERLAKYPPSSGILFNAGTAAYLSKDYDSALSLWKQLKALIPDDPVEGQFFTGSVRSKLIQVYNAKGMKKERDAERQELLSLVATGTDPEIKKMDRYVCDQFDTGGVHVMVFENLTNDKSEPAYVALEERSSNPTSRRIDIFKGDNGTHTLVGFLVAGPKAMCFANKKFSNDFTYDNVRAQVLATFEEQASKNAIDDKPNSMSPQ
jgi:tetratricopeptide (TPR) repeat protein